jgi:putative membrane protein
MAAENFWRWQPHPEVWLLLAGLLALGLYATRVVGPKIESKGLPGVQRSHKRWFAVGMVLLWIASDWPMHDISEEYLYSVHMTQHLLLTLVIPPIFLMATPTWFARLILGEGQVKTWVYRLARPVPAAVIFNGLQIFTHWSGVVNTTVESGPLHYGLHTAVVASALLLWMPVCGPIPELRISLPNQMVYLFLTSIIPTIPAAWLTFADGAVYEAYDTPARLFGISVTSDQQAAGLIMKLAGGVYLWVLITMLFFRFVNRHEQAEKARRAEARRRRETETLTWDQVEAELEAAGPPPIESVTD